MRLWLKFARNDSLAYISHLDAHRTYYRMFRRASLPMAYSQGFNPHPIISLAAPLPLGFCSRADYVDMVLAEPMSTQEVCHRLQTVTGSDALRLLGCAEIKKQTKSLAALLSYVRYTISLNSQPDEVEAACRVFLATEQVTFEKHTKSKTHQLDARKLVRDLVCCAGKIDGVFSLGDNAVFRPDEFLTVLRDLSGAELLSSTIIREELFLGDVALYTPLQWAEMEGEGSE